MRLLLGILAAGVFGGMAQDYPGGQLKHIFVPTVNGMNLVAITARAIEREMDTGVDHLRGQVEIKTPFCVTVKAAAPKEEYCDGYVVLRADEAEFHEDTEQEEARGNVRVERAAGRR